MVIRTCCRCRFSRDRVAHSCGGNGTDTFFCSGDDTILGMTRNND